jgi:hypothetical protein
MVRFWAIFVGQCAIFFTKASGHPFVKSLPEVFLGQAPKMFFLLGTVSTKKFDLWLFEHCCHEDNFFAMIFEIFLPKNLAKNMAFLFNILLIFAKIAS